MAPSDDNLLRRATGGDSEAFRTLLQRHGPAVRRRIMGRIPRRWRSVLTEDDVMQQTYADAIQSLGRFVPSAEGSFRGWLASLAKCNLQDAIKMLETVKRGGDRRRIEAVADGDAQVSLLRLLSADTTTPSQHAARREAQSALQRSLQELPEAYRRVVQLLDLEGESAAVVAEALGRSVGAVYMLRMRAHDRLRALLGATGKFFTDSA